MELYVFDINFNRLGVIDNYEEVEIERKYYKHSTLSLTVKANEENIKLLLSDDYRILVKSTDLSRGYIVEIPQFEDGKSSFIEIKAYSLSIMTNWRIIQGQQRFKGNLESVIKGFVNANCINPNDPKRKIPNLVLGANTGINITTDEMYNNKQLDESLWEICEKFEVSYEILMNHDTKKFEFIVYQGADRSAEQNINPHIIFAKAFDNVTKQSFVDDKSNYRSTAYVAGEGEGAERTVLKVNDNFSGLERRELFIDARDLQSNYRQDDGTEITIPTNEYLSILQERGLNKLSEYQRIRTFESDIDNSQFEFEKDYFLGDKVTTRNDELNIITHARVVVAKEKYDRKGYELKIEFGASIPTFIDKVKREIKNQSSSGGSSGSVVSEIEWNNVKDKPSTFPPTAHTHEISEVNGLQDTLNEKASNTNLTQLDTKVTKHLADITSRGYLDSKVYKGIDANTITENGKYALEDCANMPLNPPSRTIFTVDVTEFDELTLLHEAVCVYSNSMPSLVGRKFRRVRRSGVWNSWREVASTEKGESFTATLQNGWTGKLEFSKNNSNQMLLNGLIYPGTIAINTTIATLPSGYYDGEFRIPMLVYDSTKSLVSLGLTLLETGELKVMQPLNTNIATGDSIWIHQLIQL